MSSARSQDIQKSVIFLYINNEHVDAKIKHTIPLTVVKIKMKYLGLILTKHVQDVCLT